jgi:hypothetical protein
MNNRIVAAVGAAALAVGILVGAAGAVVIGDVASGANGRAMWGQMMPMMGGGSMMGGADFDDMAQLHAQHHGTDR